MPTSRSRRARYRLTAPGLLLTLACPLPAAAVGSLVPYGSAQVEYNSNIFALESREQALAQNGDDRLSDRLLRYVLGVEGKLTLSQQALRAKVEGRRVDFDRFGYLDHDEYLLSAGLDWQLSSAVDGLLELGQERRMASFEDRNTTDLTLETERTARATANVDITPEWRLETGLERRELDSPLPNFPDFELTEDTAGVAIKYLLIDRLAAGVYAEALRGRFKGTANSGRFHQESLALVADYSVEDFSSVGAELGITKRTEANGGGGDQALTGELSYHRELTGKTKVDLQVFRRVRSYVGGASSVTEDGASLGLAWQATVKTSVAALYQWTQGSFQDAGAATENSGRSDQGEIASLKVSYQMLPWIALRPYGGYQLRDSNTPLDSFEASFIGFEVLARLQ